MNKKRLSLIIATIGVFLIIICSVILKVIEKEESKETKYLKKSLVVKAEECIKDNLCEKRSITLNELKVKGYLDNSLLELLDNYSLDSIISYPTKDVNLIKK